MSDLMKINQMLILAGVIVMSGCSSKVKTLDLSQRTTVLKRTELVEPMTPGSDIEKEALKRFDDFYAVYSVEAIKAGIREVYAEDAWFGDPFHLVEGIDEIEHYFVVMAEPVDSCTFVVESMQRSGVDYFACWTMSLVSKAAKGSEPIEVIGVSHVRFNKEGKIVFQQDYWDTSVMFDRLPVVGYWTRLVKNRIAKGVEK